MGVRRTLLGALLAPLVLLAACGGGSSVADPPVSPSSPSSSSTQPPKRESPEHFIRRWFSVGTVMQNTGDTDHYRALQNGCSDCLAVANRVDKAYAAGGYYKTRGVRTLQIVDSRGTQRHRIVDVKADLAPTIFVERRGAPIKHFTGGTAHFEVRLESHGTSWLVTNFIQVAT